MKSMNASIGVVGTSDQLFRRGSTLKENFQKSEVVTDKTPSFVIGSFCNSYSICFNIGFWQSSFI